VFGFCFTKTEKYRVIYPDFYCF